MGLGYEPGGTHNPKMRDFSDSTMRDQGPNNMPGERTNGSELNNNLPERPSQPSPPSTQQPTSPDPQEFADQKKAEVKKTYSTSHADRINNAYRDHYGRNAHADEIANWTGTGMGIEDIQRGLKTSYGRDGEHLEGEALANLQIRPDPQGTTQPVQPVQPVQPEPGRETQPVQPEPGRETQPGETKPPTLVEHENRFAGSNAFKDQLEAAKNLGQTPTPQTSATSSSSSQPSRSSDYGQIDNNQGLATSRDRVDSMLSNQSNSFDNQLQREADMRANSPITQDVTNRYQQFSLLNDDAQRGRGDFSSFANDAIQGGRSNREVDTAALDMDLRRGIQNMGDKATLSNLNIFGDTFRNSRENPYSWTPSQPTPKPKTPDFQQIYRDNMDNINSI